MQRLGLIPRIWGFLRTYAVALALIGGLGFAFFEVYVTGVGPMPQQPPEGYTIERTKAALQWSKGTRKGGIKLQVAMDDPSFTKPILEKDVKGKSHTMNALEPGHTYYWRLVQGDDYSPIATFKTSAYAIKF
ncbi:MAG: hypothetical protein GY854_12105 [Deltaproteobacteria bacterium]|nr:hypothetical protein [Deltaproteobacteria bacterium]